MVRRQLVHHPPHDYCNTPMILGVGTSYKAIRCVIFLLRLKRKAAITTKQCRSGQPDVLHVPLQTAS